MKKKYYFITYQANNKQGGHTSIWNQVIDISPMEFIKNTIEVEEAGSRTYYNFVVINTCEITKKEFEKYCLRF